METINPINDGSSLEKAIVINVKSEIEGVLFERTWLSYNYPGYKLSLQCLSSKENKNYDIMIIETAEGINKKIHFDITSFFGKL